MAGPLAIVGDSPELGRLEQLLSDWGWACLRVEPAEVTATLARTKPPLLLVALAAGESGRAAAQTLTRRIQATAYGALVPVVFFGPEPGPNPAEVVALGGDVFLPVPVDPESLRVCVTRLAGDPVARPRALGPAKTSPGRPPAPGALGRPTPREPAPTAGPPPPRPSEAADDLAALEALPWEGLPELSATRRRLAAGPGAGELGLEAAMAGDALLDPRALAESIASQAPWDAFAEGPAAADAPADAPGRGAPEASDPPEPTTDAATRQRSPASPIPTRPTGPVELPEEPSEIDAIVRQFVIPGGDADTVAVKIQKAISAFEDQHLPREERTPPDREPLGKTGAAEPGEPPPSSLPETVGEARLPPPDDEIDLAALDVDTIAGVDAANPEELLARLREDHGTPHPASGPVTHVTLSPGTPRLIGPPESPQPGAGRREDERPGSAPGPGAAEAAADRAHEDESVTQPPWREEAVEARYALPEPGETRLPSAPLASPYDLPPVMATAGQVPFVAERGFRDHKDTVPGRRTAILQGDAPEPEEADEAPEPLPPRAGVTQPERPVSLRAKAAPVEPAPAPRKPAPTPTPRTPPPVPADLREGRLEEHDPASLLWRLGQLRLTGSLRIEAEGGILELVLEDGRIRFATSSRPADRMLTLLQRRGQISASQAAEVEEEITRSGRRAGAILLDRGWIRSAELIPTIRDHLESLVTEVFALERGAFRFRAERPLHDEIVHLERPPAAIVLEGVRRKYVPERIMALAGATEVTPVRRPDGDEGLLEGCPVTGKDWRLLDAMDGRRTLSELADDLGAPLHQAWSLAWALHCLGLVALAPAGATRAEEQSGQTSPVGAARRGSAGPASFEVEIQRILNRRRLAREGDYFAVLGAAPDATAAEVAEAWDRARSQLTPPELPALLSERYAEELREILEVLDEAASVLTDDVLRERYRTHLLRASEGAPEP